MLEYQNSVDNAENSAYEWACTGFFTSNIFAKLLYLFGQQISTHNLNSSLPRIRS